MSRSVSGIAQSALTATESAARAAREQAHLQAAAEQLAETSKSVQTSVRSFQL